MIGLFFLLAGCLQAPHDPAVGDSDTPTTQPRNPSTHEPSFDDPGAVVEITQAGAEGTIHWGAFTASFRHDNVHPYVVVQQEGDCRRLASETSLCKEPCSGYCLDGVCHEFSPLFEVGDLELEGAAVDHVEPVEGWYWADSDGAFVQPGDEVIVSATGGELSPFSVAAFGTPAFQGHNFSEVSLAEGQPLALSWTPALDGSRVRLEMVSDTASHGQFRPSVVQCDAPDDQGTIEVPQALVDAHAHQDNWGCGDCAPSTIARYTHSDTEVDGVEVRFRVQTESSLFLVPGM